MSVVILGKTYDVKTTTQLSIFGNNLTSLPEGIFQGLPNLKRLDIFNNKLTSLPEGIFQGLPKLEVLQLSYNKLTSLPEGIFQGLPNLEVNLSHNNLTTLPEGIFQGLTNLERVDLSGNNLISLPEGIFQGLTNLEAVDLSDNNLRSLPEGIFQGLENLKYLYFSYNNLTSLPEGIFQSLTNLNELYLSNNKLTSLPIITNPNLAEFTVDENSFDFKSYLRVRSDLIPQEVHDKFKHLVEARDKIKIIRNKGPILFNNRHTRSTWMNMCDTLDSPDSRERLLSYLESIDFDVSEFRNSNLSLRKMCMVLSESYDSYLDEETASNCENEMTFSGSDPNTLKVKDVFFLTSNSGHTYCFDRVDVENSLLATGINQWTREKLTSEQLQAVRDFLQKPNIHELKEEKEFVTEIQRAKNAFVNLMLPVHFEPDDFFNLTQDQKMRVLQELRQQGFNAPLPTGEMLDIEMTIFTIDSILSVVTENPEGFADFLMGIINQVRGVYN